MTGDPTIDHVGNPGYVIDKHLEHVEDLYVTDTSLADSVELPPIVPVRSSEA